MTATAATVEAQAKVNLRLRILARETGGYHQIETLFQRLELADTVRVATDTTARTLDCGDADLGPMERNLAWRAAAAFAAGTGWPRGFAITIEKRIPVGGGLGGGSADAGAVLRALNALARRPLDPADLATLAAGLGADVPFLATDRPLALGWGRGERLLGLRPLPAREVALWLPGYGVATAEAYGWVAAAREASGPPGAPLSLDDLDRWDAIARLATNDFEGPVFARHPDLATARERLEGAGARIARLSGSGSTVFGIFDRRPADLGAGGGGAPAGGRVLLTRTATSVPAVRMLE